MKPKFKIKPIEFLFLEMSSTSNRTKPKTNHHSTAKQIRDVQRSLKLETISASSRVELERKLKALQQASMETKTKNHLTTVQKSHMEKYRMIRFFERKKALRKLQSLMKSNAPVEEIERATLNLNYVVHFPKDTKYISLYPGNESKSPVVSDKKEKIMEIIKNAIISGSLNDAASELLRHSSGPSNETNE